MYSVTRMKVFRGREGYGFNADLLRDGKKAAFVYDEASGGSYNYEFVSRVEQEKFEKHCDNECPGVEKYFRADHFVSRLVDEFESAKRLKRLCRDKVLFRLPGDREGEWRTCTAVPFDLAKVVAHVRSKYGSAVEIANGGA